MTQKILPYNAADYHIFVGIDVDTKSFAVTFKDKLNMNISKKMPAEPKYLSNYIKRHFANKKVISVYEAGPTGYHLYDYMKRKKQTCLVVSPGSIPKARNEKVKTNRLDSVKLARQLKLGDIKPIRVPEGDWRDLRYLIESRENYVKARKIAKQRIKSLLLQASIKIALNEADKNWSKRYIKYLDDVKCSHGVRVRLNMLLVDLDYTKVQTLNILRQLREFFKEHKAMNDYHSYLKSIPGIGFITAATILGRVGNPVNIANVREIGSFVGLVPKENSTGDNIRRGSITHMGNRVLRSLLIEAAWSAIRKDKELAQFFYRIKKRNNPEVAARIAITAVARKLTHRVYRVLKERRNYIVH